MKLVINIDDGLYKAICDCDRFNVQNLSHFAIKRRKVRASHNELGNK